ncbi:P1 family peptidase [Agromyces archimandritae]|uniref:P1 family peptidase n=1 Tax=Agromyces archimandritae TaxID=2781962 RepID=A0A975FL17_9MICO|nr:P1 family peptidase [Agromyces archimandritae]QTX03707.1 P1 family peptidase [Agromyces archimandritae]
MTTTAPRARDLGIPFDGRAGRWNAITDVPGVEVGYATIASGDPAGPGSASVARTGVTAILPRGRDGIGVPCAAGTFSLNGNGELTGRTWIDESGALTLPIALTNSHAVGAVHRGVDEWVHRTRPDLSAQWMLPVVGETWDGYLNAINAGNVRPEHAGAALDAAHGGAISEGSVGGGTGMTCYGFKGGSGTASRLVEVGGEHYTVGVFLQANFGSRDELRIDGRRLGRSSAAPNPMETTAWLERDGERARVAGGSGSVIVVVATDAPLLPGQCAALARRVPLGLARTGTTASHFSGDIFLAFSTANPGALTSMLGHEQGRGLETLAFVPWGRIDPFFAAVVEAVEEATVNALVAARDTVGRDGHVAFALPHDEVRSAFAAPPHPSPSVPTTDRQTVKEHE